MDPVSLTGLAIGVASLGLQVYTGCIQGIQLLVTALGYDEECKYLNLRLRMEQQRLFAWSETSGLLDLDANNHDKILDSNIFNLHRQTVLDLLVQVQCLFDEFTAHQRRHNNLKPVRDDDNVLAAPDKDARQASFPMSPRKRDFIKKAMAGLKLKSEGGWMRLRWVSFDKEAFEKLLAKFSALNDNMTNILDHSLQVEIRDTVQDTNRGVLLLHHKVADLSHLVLALKSQLEAGSPGIQRTGSLLSAPLSSTPMSKLEREVGLKALLQLSNLAKFKAFNETIDPKSGLAPTKGDVAAYQFLDLASPAQPRNVQVPRNLVELDPEVDDWESPRCEALLTTAEGTKKRVWIEWKDYDSAGQHPDSLSKRDIVDRVRKLACLLNHSPKPEAFRTPHCLGFFDKADPDTPDEDVDVIDRRLGLIFERPHDDQLHASLPPVSLHDLLRDTSSVRKPRVTERVRLAHALSNCVLYLHAVNWLHKGLRSHNVLFFRARGGGGVGVDYSRPYLSGFDFSRPGGPEEMTDAPGDDAEHDLYRHPRTQSNRRGSGSNGDKEEERERSKKSFDVYSLGVVLVELAHWRTVDEVLALDMRRARGDKEVVRRVRQRLLAEDRVADLGAEMGEKYEEATRACLAGGASLGLRDGDDETDDEVAERLSMRYYEDVVKKLGSIAV
ncbi:hypothetical protein JDV02_007337 [Purpureocillium takamizusanense]|uniref:Protein kinase domain-containing protein n=2 Tax=Purpureocillium takamizusanense TaxID=2060973 RepID=A0A9Q8QKC3_9HYPO|nr:uncharacterized protein JDV02_007337 [Purpureocillium takamizusanense]UNI21338.1 hypothetical protein JDV02_007337 [Purpureocillium takamizusanense]